MGGGAVWRLSPPGEGRGQSPGEPADLASTLRASRFRALAAQASGQTWRRPDPGERGGGVPGPLPLLLPSSPGVGNGLRRPEDSLRGGSAGSGFQPCCRLDWMTQNGSHGSGGRRGGKRYPSQLGTLSSLPGPAGLFALLRPSWVFLLGCSCSSCLHGWPLLTLQVSNQIPPPLPGERIGERPSFPSPASPTVDPACLFGA